MKHGSVSPQQTPATSSWSRSPRPPHLCSPYEGPGILVAAAGGHQAAHSTRLQMGGQQVGGPERVTRGDAPALPLPTVQTRAAHKPCQDQPRWTALFRSQGGSRTQQVYTPPQCPGIPDSGHSRWAAPSQGPWVALLRPQFFCPCPCLSSVSGVGLLPSRLHAWVIPAQQASWRVSTPMVSSGPILWLFTTGHSPLPSPVGSTSRRALDLVPTRLCHLLGHSHTQRVLALLSPGSRSPG